MKQLLLGTFIGLALCALAAAPAAAGALATVDAGPAGITWQPALAEAGLTLTISGPEGFYLRQELAPGQSPTFSVFDDAGNHRSAGAYVWELRPVFKLTDGAREELGAIRDGADDATLRKAAGLPDGKVYQSGSFSIVGGEIVAPDRSEPTPGDAGGGNQLAAKATVLTNADGVIRNSLCVGFDCPNSPSFSDTTILMMENNTRIKFDDTSNTASFPDNDWEIEANSSLNGGAEYLGFNDCGSSSQGGCATDLVFAVEAGTRASALYVESDGDVGMGTSNPVVTLHIVDGNTPTLRLEQDASGGFTPQTWDVAGNETNFFIRDATGGSKLPFRIQPTAPSNSVFIELTGDVGFGTSAPIASVDLKRDQPLAHFQDNQSGAGWAMGMDANEQDYVISKDGTGGTEVRIRQRDPAGTGSPTMDVDGDIEAVDFNMASSRDIKTDFQPLDGAAVLARLAELPLMEWSYKKDPTRARHLGPVAEDFQAAFGLSGDGKTISLIEANGVALAAIQGLHAELVDKAASVARLERENRAMQDRQLELETQLTELTELVRSLAEPR